MIHCWSVDSDFFIFCSGETIHLALIVSMHFSVDVGRRSCRSLLYENKNIVSKCVLWLKYCVVLPLQMIHFEKVLCRPVPGGPMKSGLFFLRIQFFPF